MKTALRALLLAGAAFFAVEPALACSKQQLVHTAWDAYRAYAVTGYALPLVKVFCVQTAADMFNFVMLGASVVQARQDPEMWRAVASIRYGDGPWNYRTDAPRKE